MFKQIIRFEEWRNISCNSFIAGGYGAIDGFINGENSTLSIDSTRL